MYCVITWKILFRGWRINFWWGENKYSVGTTFCRWGEGGGGGGISKFLAVGGDSPISLVGKFYIYIIHIYNIYTIHMHIWKNFANRFHIQWRSSICITYSMCLSGHLTSSWFEQFLCHRYIWYIYIYIFFCLSV